MATTGFEEQNRTITTLIGVGGGFDPPQCTAGEINNNLWHFIRLGMDRLGNSLQALQTHQDDSVRYFAKSMIVQGETHQTMMRRFDEHKTSCIACQAREARAN
jgi:hypothetical protein